MKKNAKLAALAILVLAAVAALSVGITLAVVNARMPAACTCSGQCRSAGTETAAAGDAPSAQLTEPSEADSISIPGFDFLSLQAGAQEQSMPLYNPENNACYFRISLLLDGEALWRSDLLAPGQTAPQQKLSRALAAGEYSAVLKYECFADEAETEPLNGSEIALTLRVQLPDLSLQGGRRPTWQSRAGTAALYQLPLKTETAEKSGVAAVSDRLAG